MEIGNKIVMSDHKRAETEGQFQEEPLLKDNPGRFVLFPIQDADVRKSRFNCIYSLLIRLCTNALSSPMNH